MASVEVLAREEDILHSSIFDFQKGESVKSRGKLVERKIDVLENLASKVSNRRARRWLNDRFLIELVPRLNAEEIRGLFAPPPWGDNVPLSAFSMTNMREWDAFRNVDMDAEGRMIEALTEFSTKRKEHIDTDKMIALNAWRRVDYRTREALRRTSLSDLVAGYEERIREFINDSGDGDLLVLHVQDPFHRLLLHGVCEFYNLISVTTSTSMDSKLCKMMRIKKKLRSRDAPPNITLVQFLRMAKGWSLE